MPYKRGEKVYVNSYQMFLEHKEEPRYLPKNTVAYVTYGQMFSSVRIKIHNGKELWVYCQQLSYEPKKSIRFYKGDKVKVYSQGAWYHGGFLEGEEATFNRYNDNGSVSVSVIRNIDGEYLLDDNFHVWPEQLELVERNLSVKSINKYLSSLLIKLAKRLNPNLILQGE